MKLALYYHIPAFIDSGKVSMPGFFGVFVDSLALEVEELVLVVHTRQGSDEYELQSPNVRLVDLGAPTSAWYRHFFHKEILRSLKKDLKGVDKLLVRCPSPLAPFFQSVLPVSCQIKYYVVGSYRSGALEMTPRSIRDFLIRQFLLINHRKLMHSLEGMDIIVNSPQLKLELEDHCRTIVNIPSTTLSAEDIDPIRETCNNDIVNILYTGRFDFQKGLRELFEAFSNLHKTTKAVKLYLHLVGWEDDINEPVKDYLQKFAASKNISTHIKWHGKKKVGEELWNMYRMADIYTLPSYHEGFPRTIWEAMSFSLPIVATNIGSIPIYLKHEETAFLCEPKSVDSLTIGIKSVLENVSLRNKLIINGHRLASENTLSIRAKQIIKNV